MSCCRRTRTLLPDARRAANALLATVSFTDIAKSVFDALVALDLDDLDAGPRAGWVRRALRSGLEGDRAGGDTVLPRSGAAGEAPT